MAEVILTTRKLLTGIGIMIFSFGFGITAYLFAPNFGSINYFWGGSLAGLALSFGAVIAYKGIVHPKP